MRYIALIILTLFQFTALPFLSIVAANTARQQAQEASVHVDNTQNVTTAYKSATM